MAKRTKAEVSVLDVLDGPFAAAFPRETWAPWRAFLAAAFGLGLEGEALETYRAHTGRTDSPAAPAKEVWCVAGRRGGKSRIAAVCAVYLSCFRRYRLAPGETGVLMVIAVDKTQAKVVFSYIRALVAAVPMLAKMVTGETAESIELANRTRIEVRAGSFRSVRGASVIAAILDEVAFMRDEASAEADIELYRALKPAMATTGGLLVGISSPYARRGLLWQKYRQHYGKDGDVLVWAAPSLAMNPTLPADIVEEALAEDPDAAKAEWLAEFRSDVAAFVSPGVVEAVTVPGRHELPPVPGERYLAFCDPSGGSADSFTCAVAHLSNGIAVLDATREVRPPFSPDGVTAEFAALLRSYGISTVVGDRYAAEWPRRAVRRPRHPLRAEREDGERAVPGRAADLELRALRASRRRPPARPARWPRAADVPGRQGRHLARTNGAR